MGIKTMSQFLYGHEITNNEHFISIDEGAGELVVDLTPSGYTFTELATELQRALNAAGANDYTVTTDRSTRKFTITGSAPFDILAGTGDYFGSAAYAALGFISVDKTGLSTYISDNATGTIYRPQLRFFDFVPSSNNESSIQSSLNESGDGNFEVINFGTVSYMELSMRYITDRTDKPDIIELDREAVSKVLVFLKYLRRKNRVEFMADRDNPDNFEKMILFRTDKSSTGIEFQLREMTSQQIQDYYETGLLVFRKVV